MTKLSAREEDLLKRIDEKRELHALFFQKVKGLRWFEPLVERGYFRPENNPESVPAKKEGYVYIPAWPAINYLVRTAPELSKAENHEDAKQFLEILVNATLYAKGKKISNYHTWQQFAKIISQIPSSLISPEILDTTVDYWLEDKYEHGLIAREIGKNWLPKLFENNDTHALKLASEIIKILYKISFVEDSIKLRIARYDVRKITTIIAKLSGEKLGIEAVQIFDEYLTQILEKLNCDLTSSSWRPAIEDHEQNDYRDSTENILIQAYRDSLDGYIDTNYKEALQYIMGMLESEYQTVQRIALYLITKKSEKYRFLLDVTDILLDEKYLSDNYRHEMWHFLNKCYSSFSESQKENICKLISEIKVMDYEGKPHKGASAYSRAIWFSAIKEHGELELDHPDFPFYVSEGQWGGRRSPKNLDELQALSIDELIRSISEKHVLEGLVETFQKLVKREPLKFYLNLSKFINLDLAYIHEIIVVYKELWIEKAKLPWTEIWEKLFEFILEIIEQEQFWNPENEKQRGPLIANRHWVVSSIGRLIEAGAKSDEHIFDEQCAEKILVHLLHYEKGSNEFSIDNNDDAVIISINSPRGCCLKALINLSLHSCRIADRDNEDHSPAWLRFQQCYDAELDRAGGKNPEYEFATLVTNYLPNFLYMSKEWVLKNLNRIFDQNYYLKWLCAMQGYTYVNGTYEQVYNYLKEHGDLLKVLDDENIRHDVRKKAMQDIMMAYIHNIESVEDDSSLINILISRNVYREICHLIWFMWSLRKRDGDMVKNKIYELWPRILKNIDLTTREGKNIASKLCLWAIFVDQVDDERRQLLLEIAPFSDESHSSYELLDSVSVISEKQPFEAYEIWIKMLEYSTPDYPEEAVKKILANLCKEGSEGQRKARDIVSRYAEKGNDRPHYWLKEIR